VPRVEQPAIDKVVVVGLTHLARIGDAVLELETIAAGPVGGNLGLASESEAGRVVAVLDDIDVFLGAVVPPQHGLVDLAVDLDRDLLVALAGGGGLELRDALLEIGAAVATKVGGFGGRVWIRAHEGSHAGSDEQARS
jgi:hypothetical protein